MGHTENNGPELFTSKEFWYNYLYHLNAGTVLSSRHFSVQCISSFPLALFSCCSLFSIQLKIWSQWSWQPTSLFKGPQKGQQEYKLSSKITFAPKLIFVIWVLCLGLSQTCPKCQQNSSCYLPQISTTTLCCREQTLSHDLVQLSSSVIIQWVRCM